MISLYEEKLITIRTLEEFKTLFSYIVDKELIAFDTETTGLDKEAKIIGISICADLDKAYYVILREWNVSTQKLEDLETLQLVRDFMLKLVAYKLIMHNGIFDCRMVYDNYKVELINSLHTDTMELAHVLDENRPCGLKDLGVAIFGEDAKEEQKLMKESVHKNGGMLTKHNFELYKADSELIGRYGAKDALLTLKVFYILVEQLYDQGLDNFFYADESMPLLRGPTYDMNTTGLKVDLQKLQDLKGQLETECMEAKAFVYKEITPIVKEEYPGTTKTNAFNIGSTKQLSWLLFMKLGLEFNTLTKEGRNLCKALDIKLPYSPQAKREFIRMCLQNKDKVYEETRFNSKTKKMARPKKIGNPWNYMASDKATLKKYAKKFKWIDVFLEYNKNLKILNTYVVGIQDRVQYGIIRPNFLQHGTTSGRYSSRNPNFQNLPRDDKRVKACIISRPGKVFVGADYSQLEPRVFASYSQDERLLKCFSDGDDFYSVIGVEVFNKYGLSLKKDEENSFAKKYPELRNISKAVALSATYGTTAHKMAPLIGKKVEEAQTIIDNYFESFPSVKKFMLQKHNDSMVNGQVLNLFGRPRRMPKALNIKAIYGKTPHAELPYEIRNILNLAVNHTIQSTGASIMNRAAITVHYVCKQLAITDQAWNEVKIVMQVHDQLILEGPEELAQYMAVVVKEGMENTVKIPGVELKADPFISSNLADQK